MLRDFHSSGEYISKYAHNEQGHDSENRLDRVMEATGFRLIKTSAREDEIEGIDRKYNDPQLGQMRIQVKQYEMTLKEQHRLIREKKVPIGIDRQQLVYADPKSLMHMEASTDYVGNLFKAQYEAFAPLASDSAHGKAVDIERVREARDSINSRMPNSNYEGTQSFSP